MLNGHQSVYLFSVSASIYFSVADYEITFCSVNGGSDECMPCPNNMINKYLTSSIDEEIHMCYPKTAKQSDCPLGMILY